MNTCLYAVFSEPKKKIKTSLLGEKLGRRVKLSRKMEIVMVVRHAG